MEEIRNLAGFGEGNRCIIVGGGHSKSNYTLDHGVEFVISCNSHAILHCDMVIFHDQEAGDAINKRLVKPYFCVTSKQLSVRYPWVTHTYVASDTSAGGDIEYGDTGFHAIQIADSIMLFDEIVLYGLDYATVGESYHHGEERSDKTKFTKFCEHSIGRVAPKINAYKNLSTIYTASRSGVLKYPHLTTRCKIG